MPPIVSPLLRRDFDRAVTLAGYNFEREQEQEREVSRREWEMQLARATAQMTAMMTWCKHDDGDREARPEGGTRCGACGFHFSDPTGGFDPDVNE